MKTTLSFVAFLVYATVSSAQISPHTPWTWMKGDNTVEQSGVYGTQCISGSANKPGARNFATSWRDATGNLWLFGGAGYSVGGSGYLNDLWKFDPLYNKWTWVKGDSVVAQHSIYGIKGNADIANKPGATFSSISWTGTDGQLWLFGGFGYSGNGFGFLNTLWKYDPANNEWTWVKGDSIANQTGIYGIKGTADVANNPGARYGSQTWVDANGCLWLYGGYGNDDNTSGILNDIWKYDPITNKWTWINGDNSVNHSGVYGTKGIPDDSNKPGARYVSTSWTDHDGNLWLFGGYGYDENNSGNLNDMWNYNPTTNQWVWVSGDKTINQTGVYGVQGISGTNNKPGGRYVSSSWTDGSNDLWLFGGYGFEASNTGYLNDLWKYNTVNKEWTWVKGDSAVDQVSVYGIQGMPDTSNKSGARTGSVSWSDGNGSLWLFGGYGFDGTTSGVLNDLWKINSYESILPLHLLYFKGVLNNEIVQLQWQAEQETGFSHFNVQRSFDGVNFTTIAIVRAAGNNNLNDYTYADNGLTNQVLQKVFYRLQLMDYNGQFTYSNIVRFDWKQKEISLNLFPNPAANTLNLSFDQNKAEKLQISITDMNGKTVRKQVEMVAAGQTSITMDIHTLSAGAYLLSVINEAGVLQQKFIKQ